VPVCSKCGVDSHLALIRLQGFEEKIAELGKREQVLYGVYVKAIAAMSYYLNKYPGDPKASAWLAENVLEREKTKRRSSPVNKNNVSEIS